MKMELITTYISKTFGIGIHTNMVGGTIMSIIDDATASYASPLFDTPRLVTSDPVKIRYNPGLQKFGKGLLSPEESI
jgi:acyl-CoA hydrolase